MSESSEHSPLEPARGGADRYTGRDDAATGTPSPAESPDAEPIVVGTGNSAAIVDHIQTVEPSPVPAADRAFVRYRFEKTVTRLRERAAENDTGDPLPVKLDRRLFQRANTARRRMVEDDIRAMHGMRLHDGRTLRVEEVLGRYGELLGGTRQQLREIQDMLTRGDEVRLAVRNAALSDKTFRQLGILRYRFGPQLRFFMEGSRIQRNSCRARLIWETHRAHMDNVRQQLQGGQRVALTIDSATFARMYHREITELRRQYGDQLTIEIDHAARRAEAIAALMGQESASLELESKETETVAASAIPTDAPAAAMETLAAMAEASEPMPDAESETGRATEPRRDLAREIAARVRTKPWWHRFRLYERLSRGRNGPS